ncbi:MAG: heavy-metal-associated domain-containing protein [Bacteroidales bacterium]|nr:heavy-metal-associated domain-containing protein [Bacteroidales bacterium]
MKKLNLLLTVAFAFAVLTASAQISISGSEQKTSDTKTTTKSCTSAASCNKSCAEKQSATVAKDISAKAGEKIVVIKANVECNNCKSKVEKQIAYVKGVKDVIAEVDKKSVTIAYDPTKTDEATLLKEVQKLNMGGEIIYRTNATDTETIDAKATDSNANKIKLIKKSDNNSEKGSATNDIR